MPQNKGFASLALIIIAVLILGGGYAVWKKQIETPPSALPEGEGTSTSPFGGGGEGVPDDPALATPINESEIDTVERTMALIIGLYPEGAGLHPERVAYYDLTDKGVWIIEADYVQNCIGEPLEETLKLILADGNCLPGTTVDELITEFEGGTWNIARLCPAQPFGYGSGYCYFRNQNPQIRALKIRGDTEILEISSPYDEYVQSRSLSLLWLKDKLAVPGSRLDIVFELEVADGWVKSITKPYISAE